MKQNRSFLFLILALNSYIISGFAAPCAVVSWASNVFKQTLTLHYATLAKHEKNIRPYYTPTAWESLGSFLEERRSLVNFYHLNVNPIPLDKARVINTGDYSGVRFWQVIQTYKVPELKMTTTFSAVIIQAKNPPFLIQSLDMTTFNN